MTEQEFQIRNENGERIGSPVAEPLPGNDPCFLHAKVSRLDSAHAQLMSPPVSTIYKSIASKSDFHNSMQRVLTA